MLLSVRAICLDIRCQSSLVKLGQNAMCTSSTLHRKSYLDLPEDFSDVEIPTKAKLPVLTKVPILPTNVRVTKMKKNLHFMRGPEEVHNALLHEQYGIVALSGGRLRFGHLEMIRMIVSRNLDVSRMFAIWRIDDPWQPVTKRGIGKRHGGGKGPIDHYVTPIKEGRMIIEVGGRCVYEEVKPWLEQIAHILPFKAMAVDQKTLLARKKLDELKEKRNMNPYTYKYLIMNRMCGSQNWVKPMDKLYFGKYV